LILISQNLYGFYILAYQNFHGERFL